MNDRGIYLIASYKPHFSQSDDVRPEDRPECEPWTLMEKLLFTTWDPHRLLGALGVFL